MTASPATPTVRRPREAVAAVAVGLLGLVLALGMAADLWLGDGIWYPVVYAGTPAIAATAAFASQRPGAHPLVVAGTFAWLFVSSVGALAVAVVLAVGFNAGVARPPVTATLFAGLLYLGFLLVPVTLAVWVARRDGLLPGLVLVLSPVGQAAVAAVLIVPR